MASLTIRYRDGRHERREDRGAPGGSYAQTVRYEDGVAIIRDAYGKETHLPLDLVESIEVDAERRW